MYSLYQAVGYSKKGLLKLQPLKLSRSILQEIVTIFLRNASSFFGWHTVTRDLVTIEIETDFMEFAPFTRFLHWFTISHPIFLQKPNWSSFFINKKLKCVNAEWRSCNVWILSEKNKVPYSTSAFPLHAYVSWHVPSIRLVVIYVWYLCVNCCMSYDLLLGIHSMEFTNYMIKWFAL